LEQSGWRVLFQRVGPRRRPACGKLWRDATHHLRAFYGPAGERHHLAAVMLPASREQMEEFLGRCADRLLAYGAKAKELPRLLDRIEERLLRENREQIHHERAADEVKDHRRDAARMLPRVLRGRRS
jgi:hypothetical protein